MWMVHVVDIIYSGHGRKGQWPEKAAAREGKNIMIRISELKLPVDHTPWMHWRRKSVNIKDKKRRTFFPGRLYADPWMHGKSRFEICLCG